VKESLATQSGTTITYGPFFKIPAASSAWLGDHQQLVTVHYNYETPMIEVTSLKRSAEISHWGNNLNIQDEMNLHNSGPT
jgi:oligosaccharyltransferase complex subunit alpha (ribophorin I)